MYHDDQDVFNLLLGAHLCLEPSPCDSYSCILACSTYYPRALCSSFLFSTLVQLFRLYSPFALGINHSCGPGGTRWSDRTKFLSFLRNSIQMYNKNTTIDDSSPLINYQGVWQSNGHNNSVPKEYVPSHLHVAQNEMDPTT